MDTAAPNTISNENAIQLRAELVTPPVTPSFRRSVDTVSLDHERDAIRTAKIMIIDDEQLVIRVVRRFLSSDGYENFFNPPYDPVFVFPYEVCGTG